MQADVATACTLLQPVGPLAQPPRDGQQPVADNHAGGQACGRAQAEAYRPVGGIKPARNGAAQPALRLPVHRRLVPVAPGRQCGGCRMLALHHSGLRHRRRLPPMHAGQCGEHHTEGALEKGEQRAAQLGACGSVAVGAGGCVRPLAQQRLAMPVDTVVQDLLPQRL